MADGLIVDLLRHGETPLSGTFCGSSDPQPEPEAMKRLQQLALAHGGWQRVISSPLQRCRVPAETLAATLGRAPILDRRLQEIHFGDWEGRTAQAIEADQPSALTAFWQDSQANPPPNGEPLERFEQRVTAAWIDLLAPACAHSLVLTHAGVIRSILRQSLALSWSQVQHLQISPGALTRLRLFPSAQARPFVLVEFLNLRLPV